MKSMLFFLSTKVHIYQNLFIYSYWPNVLHHDWLSLSPCIAKKKNQPSGFASSLKIETWRSKYAWQQQNSIAALWPAIETPLICSLMRFFLLYIVLYVITHHMECCWFSCLIILRLLNCLTYLVLVHCKYSNANKFSSMLCK